MKREKGFTLIEILLVVVIIGIMLAVIVPRAWRANVDSKYGLVRQGASELASYGMEWAEQQIVAQEDSASSVVGDYLDTLANSGVGNGTYWVANEDSNWCGAPVNVANRTVSGTAPSAPQAVVKDIIPPEKLPRNPFNGAQIFASSNLPSGAGVGNPIPGALACSQADEDDFVYYAFLFQGTDSTTIALGQATTWHAGMSTGNIEGLRNGVFFARVNAH